MATERELIDDEIKAMQKVGKHLADAKNGLAKAVDAIGSVVTLMQASGDMDAMHAAMEARSNLRTIQNEVDDYHIGLGKDLIERFGNAKEVMALIPR